MQGYLINTAIIAEKDALFAGEVHGAEAVLETLSGDLDPACGVEEVPNLITDAVVSILRAAGGLEGAGPDLREALGELSWAWRLSKGAAHGSGWDMVRLLDKPAHGAMGPARPCDPGREAL